MGATQYATGTYAPPPTYPVSYPPPLACPISGPPPVLGIDVSPERKACVDQEGRCVVWDTRDTQHPLSIHQGHTAPLPRSHPHSGKPAGVCLADKFICVGAWDSLVALYHLDLPGTLCRHWYGADKFGNADVFRLSFSPRTKRIIATDSLGAVKLFEVAQKIPSSHPVTQSQLAISVIEESTSNKKQKIDSGDKVSPKQETESLESTNQTQASSITTTLPKKKDSIDSDKVGTSNPVAVMTHKKRKIDTEKSPSNKALKKEI